MQNLTRLASDLIQQRVLAALILTLILCVIMPLKELPYTLWGKSAPATLVSIKPERRGEETFDQWKRVAYDFVDNGVPRAESDLVTTNWPIPGFDKTGMAPPGATVDIEYIPGGTKSRLKGNDDKGWYWGSGIVAILSIIAAGAWWKFRGAS